MRPATASELPEEQKVFKTSWELLKTYRNITQEEGESWRELINSLEDLSRIGAGTPCGDFSRAVAVALADYLERQSKGEVKMAI